MRHRRFFLVVFVAIAVLGLGGVLLATSHSSGTSSALSVTAEPALPNNPERYSSMEPVNTCPAGCPVPPGDCPTNGHPCICPDGAHGKCCVHSPTDISCVRNK